MGYYTGGQRSAVTYSLTMIPVASCKDSVIPVLPVESGSDHLTRARHHFRIDRPHLFKAIHNKSMCFHDWFHLSSEGPKKLAGSLLDCGVVHRQNGNEIHMRVWIRLAFVDT